MRLARLCRRRWLSACGICAWSIAGFATPGAAQQAARDTTAPGFRVDSWTTDDGLPSHTISSIAQTSDGYLWLATPGGLVRFDGFSFQTYASDNVAEFSGSRVHAVYAGAGDTLWVLLELSGVYAFAHGRFHRVVESSRGMDYLVQDGRGRLYGGNTTLWRLDSAGSRHQVGVVRPAKLFPLPQPQVARDAAGDVWVLDDVGNALNRVTDNGLEIGPSSAGAVIVTAPSSGEVLAVRPCGARGCVVDRNGAVRVSYEKRTESRPRLIDAQGTLWVTTNDGIEAYVAGRDAPIARIALPKPATTIVMTEDREGNIWCGTDQDGLWRIQRTAFGVVSRAQGLAQEEVTSLWPGADGAVFASDPSTALFRVASPRAAQTTRTAAPAFAHERAALLDVAAPPGVPAGLGAHGAAFVDSHGTLWFGWGRRNEKGFLVGRRAGHADIVLDRVRTPVQIVENEHRPGTIWFHDGAQVYRAEPYSASLSLGRITWGVGGLVRDLAIDREGTAWLPGVDGRGGGGRLIRIAHDTVRKFAMADGLPTEELRSVVVDRDDVVWIGTYGAGIYRYKNGKFAAVTERNGLAENVVSAILVDSADNFWMSGNRGVHRVSRTELNAFLDGKVARVHGIAYNRRDGLLNPEASGWRAARATDGRLWFPTYNGAAVVSPSAAIGLDATPPLVRIEAVRVGGDSVPLDSAARLPRGRRRLEFAYTGISLRNPAAVRFQYRLDGVDAEWVDAGAARVAVYNRVGPGLYTFRVRAINGGAVPSTTDATLRVGVPPFFHETRLFAFAVALAIIGLAYGAHRYRVRDLERRRVQLNRVVDERTAALAAEKLRTEATLRTVTVQAEQLRALDEAKSRFFANVSHEFRTPLSLILGPLEDIREGRTGPVTEPANRKLDTVIASGRRLVRLVYQLLDIARLEANALQLHADVHDVVAYLRRTAESFASLADRRGIEFLVSCPVGAIRVRFDSDQMDKVFGNLLCNAFKFTASGRVELRATTEDDGGESWVVISVADTGAGIPAEHLPRVFDRFYQVDDSAHREHEGACIGLALTKELVELHGGRISVESTPGHGSTFTVRLPLAAGDAKPLVMPRPSANIVAAAVADDDATARGGATAASAAEPEDMTTVLLVEDNTELRAYLAEHLASRYRVLEAANGVDALAIAREHVPDLIVSDIMMPEMDGQALCEAIKADAEIDFIPVILLTAKASRESRLAGLEIGADDYLTKPVDLRELFVRAENLIKSRRRLRERFREEHRTLPTLAIPLVPARFDSDAEAFVRKLYDVFAKHLAEEDVQVDVLAQELSMSRRTLYRRVESVLGRSPMDVLREYRLDQAAQWLRETDAYVSEVAYGVGFKSVPHFCTRFRERFGATPSAFRASAQAG